MAWEFELIAETDVITEGPAWDGTGLFYTAIDRNEIRRYDPVTGDVKTVYTDTNRTNGLVLGPDGSLYACEQETGDIARYDTSGTRTVLVSQFEGKRLNSPNDLALALDGSIWFTDPRYGDATGKALDHDSVYHITPSSASGAWTITRATLDTTRPNGILLSPDERTLYVAQSDYGDDKVRQLRAYPIHADGTLGQYRVLHDFDVARGIDGMCWDTEGNIVATCGWELSGPGPRVAVFTTDGAILEEHPIPGGSRPTNCTFGDADLTTLYVTTIDGKLFRVTGVGRKGYLQPPRTKPYGAA